MLKKRYSSLFLIAFVLIVFSCSDGAEKDLQEEEMTYTDPHTYAEPDKAVIKHLDWSAKIDFEEKIISAKASLEIETDLESESIILDINDLDIERVTLDDEEVETTFTIGEKDPHMGSPLKVNINPHTKKVNVYYRTTSHSEALQWLDPVQTADGNHPFLFTQSQAILARSWIPIQDSPGIRFTYEAKVEVPAELLALMSAENPTELSDSGEYNFRMEQPIPAYLMALSVGHLEFDTLGPRTGVYAEPSVIRAAAYEFGDLEKMLASAEEMYGPYLWDRYDIIVLPPSFPFGGMENPRLTFATPTILAGDRSLTSLVAHELAHSWSGNLVTNATWDDFWLNEGFTVYFEQRIMESLYGRSYSEMLAQLSLQDLQSTVDDMVANGNGRDTHLKLDLTGRNPDDGVSSIAYDKGYFFLRWLEEKTGRDAFDEFLSTYFEANQFKSMTTESFMEYLQDNLLENGDHGITMEAVNQWVYNEGLPATLPIPISNRFDRVDRVLGSWGNGEAISSLISPEVISSGSWSTHEWLHFIRNLPERMSTQQMSELDRYLNFSNSGNSEVLAAWGIHVIRNDYSPGYRNLENFLITVGRRKFLEPLYKEMAKTPEGKARALRIYEQARPNYHSVSTNTLDKLLDWQESS